ncbi:TonB family protein [candidate division KSB1 bacterium]|nr:TonB family protein [candidate division KSB1 bacterium]RQW04240.1 MAG: TonB family protein [candidate division KSB1 bacterium]
MIRRAINSALCLSFAVILGCASTASRFRPAKVISDKELEYPLSAQLDKIEGEVVVGVFVDTEGKAEQLQVLESSGHAVLDTAAYHFASTLTFDPAIIDEKPVSSWTKLILRYKLTEVPFERNTWLQDVMSFQRMIESTQDSVEKKQYQQKLYMRYVGITTYLERYDDLSYNELIHKAVTKYSRQRWADFSKMIVAPFMLFDDFLYRYPESEFRQNAKLDLIRLLIDAERAIRLDALDRGRMSRQHAALLDEIKKRLDELQRDDYNKMKELFPLHSNE